MERDTGHVAAWMSEAGSKAEAKRSAAGAIMTGILVVCRFAASAGGVPTTTMTSGAETDQLCRKLVVCLGLTEGEPVFDLEILTLDVAKVAKPAAHRLDEMGDGGRGNIAETRYLWRLLRASRERPSRRARGAVATNSRRLKYDMVSPPMRSSLPQRRRQVLTEGLKCSELEARSALGHSRPKPYQGHFRCSPKTGHGFKRWEGARSAKVFEALGR